MVCCSVYFLTVEGNTGASAWFETEMSGTDNVGNTCLSPSSLSMET